MLYASKRRKNSCGKLLCQNYKLCSPNTTPLKSRFAMVIYSFTDPPACWAPRLPVHFMRTVVHWLTCWNQGISGKMSFDGRNWKGGITDTKTNTIPRQVSFIRSTIYFPVFTILHLFHANPNSAPQQVGDTAAALGLGWIGAGGRPDEAKKGKSNVGSLFGTGRIFFNKCWLKPQWSIFGT